MPVPAELMRLWNDYMDEEYRDLDCDFVFVNLWGGRVGRPLTYKMVDKIVARTQRQVGFHFTAQQLRYTYATLAYRDVVALEVIGALLTHRSPHSALIYTHPTAEDLRGVLAERGVLEKMRIWSDGRRASACSSGWRRASLRARLRAALEESQRQREEIARLRDELAHGRVRELELDRCLRRS